MKKFLAIIILSMFWFNTSFGETQPYKAGDIVQTKLEFNSGNTIILYTSRGTGSGTDWTDFTKKQVDSWGVKYHELLLGKPRYDIFVDDRAINNEEWYKQNNLEIE